jgi:hypothetical protein
VTLSDVRYDGRAKTIKLNIEPASDATYETHFIGTLRTAVTTGQPTLASDGQPPKDKAGKALRVSRKYSSEIGQVLAKVSGLTPEYKLQGNELYVRAVVISSQSPVNPLVGSMRNNAEGEREEYYGEQEA